MRLSQINMLLDIFSSMDFSYSNLGFGGYVFIPWGFSFSIVMFFSLGYFCNLLKKRTSHLFYIKGWFRDLTRFRGLYFFISGCFRMLLIGNIIGLFPYIFRPTSHIFFNACFSVVFWVSIFLSSYFLDPVGYLGHHTPMGSPLILSFALKIIELISKFIRPLTLCLRLSVKIRTGHIFIYLLRGGCFRSFTYFFVGLFVLGFYFIFEIAICFVQAFVFGLLLVKYAGEI